YMQIRDPKYIESNFDPSTYIHLKINAIILSDAQGKLIFSQGYDFQLNEPWAIPRELEKAATSGGALTKVTGRNFLSGIIITSAGPMIVAVTRILPTKSGTVVGRGFMVMARKIDSSVLAPIGNAVGGKVAINELSSLHSVSELSDVAKAFNENHKLVINRLSQKEILGYHFLSTLDGSRSLVFRIQSDRKIFEQGKYSLDFILRSSGVAFIVMLLFGLLFDRIVLSRLASLSRRLQEVGFHNDSHPRIEELEGNDELSAVSKNVNRMLERLGQVNSQLFDSQGKAQATLTSIGDAVVTTDLACYITYLNPAAERISGMTNAEALGQPAYRVFNVLTLSDQQPQDDNWLIEVTNAKPEGVVSRQDGQEFYVHKTTTALSDHQGQPYGFVTVLRDITDQQKLSLQLAFQSTHDALTGLANRFMFDTLLKDIIVNGKSSGKTHCIAYMDLDQFKVVNDAYGHLAGDELIRQVSQLIKSTISDAGTLARLGGDEFVILVESSTSHTAAAQLAEKIVSAFKQPFSVSGLELHIGCSIGITIFPDDGEDAMTLLKNADAAMYRAKEAGRDGHVRYSTEL
ncbi:MAG: diguanylate cyclase, partial [Methylococcaceae bacterium]